MALINRQRNHGGQRRTQRFPVECDLSYTILCDDESRVGGTGRAINISSRGVLFTTQHALEVGQEVELSIRWPAKLDGRLPLKLVVSGKVVRSGVKEAAVEIQNYDFRIRGLTALQLGASAMPDAPGIPEIERTPR